MAYELVVIGASWGGLSALGRVLDALPDDFAAASASAQHPSPHGGAHRLPNQHPSHTRMPLADAEDKQPVEPGHVYLAPPDYHLYVDEDGFSLSVDDPVLHSRPSIDVLFESASDVYRDRLAGVVLTGANDDGANGLARIKRRGGFAIVQNPVEAERPEMPRAAMHAVDPDRVLSLAAIGPALVDLCGTRERAAGEGGR